MEAAGLSASGAAPRSMRAWRYSKFGGGADALELNSTVEVPRPSDSEILIKVGAASVNPVDWKIQKGIARPFAPPSLPWTPGLDVAGEVVEAGAKTPFALGDQVFGNIQWNKGGGFAEYAVLPAGQAARRPPSVSPAEAACLGVAGQTALQFLRDWGKVPMLGLEGGEGGKVDGAGEKALGKSQPINVLVTNASGGVGQYAVQLARLAGAHVTATCGERNMKWVKSLGADEVLDYKTKEGAALTSPSGAKYDVVLDGTTTLPWSVVAPVLTSTGMWVHLTPSPQVIRHALLSLIPIFKQKVVTGFITAKSKDLSTLAALCAQGQLKTKIDAEVPFSQAPEAWRKSIDGHVSGKVVVVMDA